ncbi:serine/threonine-protein kinase [Nonomuraea sp. NPDC003804]|uniref:serine/threonine-protein kinase n=1 Tax=Nonomuraea sp. NPDC003804 TaxID=3154547 RepID=UPI0033BA9400
MNQIGRYRLLNVLGRGGMGTVHLAEDSAGQRVAIKVINPELSQHEQFRMRFRREADAALRVRRFCTAAVLEAALDGDQLYVVTEYVPGPNLEEAVGQSGPLRGSSLDALAVSVATALIAIHAAGVVHRDLKPSNVLLSPVGPRVIDFGIARALDEIGGVTGTGELIGTPRYMAPEVLRGEPVSPACDVFSWGCLMAFAATGRAPFPGETLPAIIYQVLNTEPALDGLEPGLRELVVAALVKDPAARPTAQQILDHLIGRQAAPEQVVQTVRVAWQEGGTAVHLPPRAGAKKARVLAGVAVAAVALVAAAGVGVWTMLPGGPPELPMLFSDDFTSTSSGWNGTYDSEADNSQGYITSDFTYGLDAGEYNEERWATAPVPFATEKPASPEPSASPTPMMPSTLVVGVTAKARSGAGEFGLWCRGQGDGDGTYYEFTLDTSGNARIRRIVDSAGGNMAAPVKLDGFNPRDKNHIQVACEDEGGATRLSMWVNGERVHQVDDPAGLPTGDIGLFARVPKGSDNPLKMVYDDFEMHGLKQQP